jgi:hypothetical protein
MEQSYFRNSEYFGNSMATSEFGSNSVSLGLLNSHDCCPGRWHYILTSSMLGLLISQACTNQ